MKKSILALLLICTVAAGTLFAGIDAVPEIDPTSVSSALALLAGGCLLVISRRRRK